MVQFDEDGYFYVTERKKRFLKVYGNSLNLCFDLISLSRFF